MIKTTLLRRDGRLIDYSAYASRHTADLGRDIFMSPGLLPILSLRGHARLIIWADAAPRLVQRDKKKFRRMAFSCRHAISAANSSL